MVDNVITPEFRVSFPSLFTATLPKDAEAGQKPKFSVTMLFAKDADLTALKKAAEQAIIEKWGADKAKWPKNMRSPFRKQEEMTDKEGKMRDGCVEGAIFIRASANQDRKPGVVGPNPKVKIEDESEVYAGCYGRAQVRAFAYDTKGNRGVSFGLQNFQKTRDGEPIGGRTRAEDAFEPVAGAEGSGGDADSVFG